MYTQLEMDFSKSTNVITVDGSLSCNALVAPNESTLVRCVMPADVLKGWSCGWGCNGSFLTHEEVYEQNQSLTPPCAAAPTSSSAASEAKSASPATNSPSIDYSDGCKRIPSEMIFFSADHDENKTNPDGSHEYVHNLCEEGLESWNKWYSGPPNEASKFNGEKVTITARLNPPQRIDRYSLISAGDNLGRAPRRWELWGQREGSDVTQWEQLHVVSNAKFTEYFERKDFAVDDEDIVGVPLCALQLRIIGSQKRGDGLQLGQLFFGTKELVRNETKAEPAIDPDAHVWRPEMRNNNDSINIQRLQNQPKKNEQQLTPKKKFLGGIFGRK